MAKLAAIATGNFTDSSKWGTIDATSYLDAETGSEVLTTAYSGTRSSTFTPGAITISHIAVKLSVRTGTTGTMSVELITGGVPVVGTEVTIDCADLPAAVTADANGGWVMLKLATPVLLIAATAYSIEAKTSSSSQISLFRDGTTDNISRFLLTTTTAAPGAGDDLVVAGEYTGSGTSNTFTITNDNTATTDFGSAPTAANSLLTPGIHVGSKGIFKFGSSSATNYYLKMSNSIIVYAGGELDIGTTGTPFPRDSTAVLEFDPGADGDYGLLARNLSTLNIQGLSRTSGKNIVACKLNTDEAVNSTDLGVDTDTGWLDNDEIVVASTTRTASQTELGALNGNAGASSLTVDGFGGAGGGIANAHGGGGTTILSTPISAEVILRTRNVKVRSATSTVMAYVFCAATATVDIDWAEFYYLGENATNKRGIEIATTTGSFNMQYSSVHDTEDGGVWLTSASGSNITISNNIFDNLNTAAASGVQGVFVAASTGITTMDSNYFSRISANSSFATGNYPIKLADAGITFTNNVIFGTLGHSTSTAPINITETNGVMGTFSGLVTHSCTGPGLIQFEGTHVVGSLSTFKSWRNGGPGFYTGVSTVNGVNLQFKLDTGEVFGNTNDQISISNQAGARFICANVDADNDPSFTTATAFRVGNDNGPIMIKNCRFGPNNPHTTDIIISTIHFTQVFLINCLLNGTTEVNSPTSLFSSNFVKSQKHDQSSTTFKNWFRTGIIQSDQTTRHTASGYSWKMTPAIAVEKLILPGPEDVDTFKVAVKANALVTIDVYVQKDGSYNGNAPRLVLVGGIVSGIASDVIDSLSVGASTWEQLEVTGTPTEDGVLEFYIDCDGTAGSIYVDDMTISQA